MYNQLAFYCTAGGCYDLAFLYFFLFPLLVIVAISTTIFFVLKKKLRFGKIFGILLGVVILHFLIFGVVPTLIEDQAKSQRAQDCAQKVGYETPGDDNSSRATAASRSAYRECINR